MKKLPACRRRRKCSWLFMTLLFAYFVFYWRYSFTLYTYLSTSLPGKMSHRDPSPTTCTADLLSKPKLVSEQKRSGSIEHITCQKILFGNGNETVYQVVREIMTAHPGTYIADGHFVELTADCVDFRRRRGYHLSPLNQEEAEFSIAYNIIMHRHIEQVGTYSKQKTSLPIHELLMFYLSDILITMTVPQSNITTTLSCKVVSGEQVYV